MNEIEASQRSSENRLNAVEKDLGQKYEKSTNLYNEWSQKYENLEGSVSGEAIRSRFISCIKHDVLQKHNEQDYQHIQTGNAKAQNGNCLRECHLYNAGGSDFAMLEKKYGSPLDHLFS